MIIHRLTIEQRVPERRFTHPAYTALDKRSLRYMLLRLHWVLESCYWVGNPNVMHSAVHQMVESDGRHHRLIIIRPHLLQQLKNISVVGFFGQKSFDGDATEAANRDEMLFTEMQKHKGLLSYSSLELTNGDYGNCVLFRDEDSKNQWGGSPVHQYAAETLSPIYYHSVRLYNGILPQSLMEEHLLKLHVVKYFDYSEEPVWRAIRKLTE